MSIKLENLPKLMTELEKYFVALDALEDSYADTEAALKIDPRYLELKLARAEARLRRAYREVQG